MPEKDQIKKYMDTNGAIDNDYMNRQYGTGAVPVAPNTMKRPNLTGQYENPHYQAGMQALQAAQIPDRMDPESQLSRMQRGRPVTSSVDYAQMLRDLPQPTSSWDRENQIRNARVGAKTLTGRYDPKGRRIGWDHGEDKALPAEMALRQQFAAEDALRAQGVMGAYTGANNWQANRDKLRSAEDMAALQARTGLSQQALQNAGFAYGSDMQYRERELINKGAMDVTTQQGRNAVEERGLINKGAMDVTTQQGRNAVEERGLINEGAMDVITQQGRDTIAGLKLSNMGDLQNTWLLNQGNLQGKQIDADTARMLNETQMKYDKSRDDAAAMRALRTQALEMGINPAAAMAPGLSQDKLAQMMAEKQRADVAPKPVETMYSGPQPRPLNTRLLPPDQQPGWPEKLLNSAAYGALRVAGFGTPVISDANIEAQKAKMGYPKAGLGEAYFVDEDTGKIFTAPLDQSYFDQQEDLMRASRAFPPPGIPGAPYDAPYGPGGMF